LLGTEEEEALCKDSTWDCETRVLIDERRLDMNRSDKNSERYVIPMHRKNVWTNEWMQDPRKNLL
jgi:hypothetical protein